MIVIIAASAAAVAHAPGETSAGHNGTITYVVTGHGSADVTYGPSGTDLAGHVPMRVTTKIGSPDYYAIQAQLNGGGRVTVEILINGKIISQGTATGGYNIAMAEITQDPLTGDWTDSQSG